jgi:hypothetical protein
MAVKRAGRPTSPILPPFPALLSRWPDASISVTRRCFAVAQAFFARSSLGFSQGFRYHLPDPGESAPIILSALAQNAQRLAQALVLVVARLNEAGSESVSAMV